mmetsp:Transcript_16517/g.15847  ORF Transcript_16517/g.15847 Transcript_16517/m.15847 type:complete len:310 (-) Transcript_16517:91-1020(-)
MLKLIHLIVFGSLFISRIQGYSLSEQRSHIIPNKNERKRKHSFDETNIKRHDTPSISDPSHEDESEDCNERFYQPLIIPCEINGFIIPAIVDTGAQVTVMSESCAKRCRVNNQIDGRYSGKAVGIGSSDITGRIHDLSMRVGPVSYQNKVSILRESRVELIIGLDFLKRFGAEINLEKRILKLKVRGKVVRISFISDDDNLPESTLDDRDGDSMNSSDEVSYDNDDEPDSHASYDNEFNELKTNKNEFEESLSSKKYSNKEQNEKVDTKSFDSEREIYVLNSTLDTNDDYFEDDENYDANDALVSLEGY